VWLVLHPSPGLLITPNLSDQFSFPFPFVFNIFPLSAKSNPEALALFYFHSQAMT